MEASENSSGRTEEADKCLDDKVSQLSNIHIYLRLKLVIICRTKIQKTKYFKMEKRVEKQRKFRKDNEVSDQILNSRKKFMVKLSMRSKLSLCLVNFCGENHYFFLD